MLLINCEISLHLKWSKDCILVASTDANQEPKFEITDTKPYIPFVTLSTQDNVNYLNNYNLVLKEQLIGISINLIQQSKRKADI